MKYGFSITRNCAFIILVLVAAPVWSAVNQIPDVRVLIDISGSMKKSDPGNLRIAATRLIAGLMPEGSRCGVWTFGRYVNMLVPVRNVDDEWRELAREKSALINSAGLYTNIEGVLENASSGWFDYDPNTKRNIILLSDGYVDVSKKAQESAESRRRIIEQTLPRLKKAGVIVHTIALSEDADHQLLETIAVATDGSYMRATEANKLNRLFLKLFEKSTEAPSLPLKDNKFKVDKSINNMTLLIMQADEARLAEVIAPNGQSFNQASHPANVKWHHEKGFDLVTVESPVAGQWQIDANIDPDNRVIVATNLELHVSPIPNSIMPNEIVHISGHMLEDGKPLIKRQLLENIEMVLLQEESNGVTQSITLSDDGIPPDLNAGDGIFSTTMRPLDVQGVYELSVIATTPTFEREYHHTINVMGEPVTTDVKELGADKGGVFLLTLTPRIDKSILMIDSLTLKLAGNGQPAVELPRDENEIWQFELPPKVSGKYLTFNVDGKIDGKRDFSYEWDIAMPGAPPLAELIAQITHEPEDVTAHIPQPAANDDYHVLPEVVEPQVKEEHPTENLQAAEPDKQATEKEDHSTNWILVIGIIVGVNLLLAIGGGVWWWVARKRKKSNEADDELEVATPESAAAKAEPGGSPETSQDTATEDIEKVEVNDSASTEGVENKAKAESDGSPEMSQDTVIEEIEKAQEAERVEAVEEENVLAESEQAADIPQEPAPDMSGGHVADDKPEADKVA
ncbi:MAG: VWA domain-containing protein [Gammaproteobacteria bacterium]|nr:VWA domain-containing protein [Gammaproteobacteria bacterium]